MTGIIKHENPVSHSFSALLVSLISDRVLGISIDFKALKTQLCDLVSNGILLSSPQLSILSHETNITALNDHFSPFDAYRESLSQHLDTMRKDAMSGCGCSYENYQLQLQVLLRSLYSQADNDTKSLLLSLLEPDEKALVTDPELIHKAHARMGLCAHGFDRDECPLGCGDIPF